MATKWSPGFFSNVKACLLLLILFMAGIAHSAPPEKSAELTIQSDGSVLFEKKTVPLAQLSDTLTEAGFGKDSSVFLRVNAGVTYVREKAVIAALGSEPSRKITLSVEQDKTTKTEKPEIPKIRIPTSPPVPFPVNTIGIKARGTDMEEQRYFFMAEGTSPTLHLRNDSGQPALARVPAGDASGARTVLRASYLLTDEIAKDAPVTLTNSLQINWVFPELRPQACLGYVAAPGDEFDLTLEFAALSNPKDPKSERKPLPKGNYRVFLEIVDVQDAGNSGVATPLFSFQLKVQ